MEEIVLKREANTSSAEALDEIAFNYPDAEILSFRKIKEAGVDNHFFVARIRIAEESKDSNSSVEDKVDKILEMVKDILEEESAEQKDLPELGNPPDADEVENPPIDANTDKDKKRSPLPAPQKPVMPSSSQTHMSPIASLIVKREASVSKDIARVELLREFGQDYRIESLKQDANFYVASLKKISDIDDEEDYDSRYDAMALEEIKEREQRERSLSEYIEEFYSPETEDEMGRSLRAEQHFDYDNPKYNLSPRAKAYMQFLDESGMRGNGLRLMLDWFGTQSAGDQERFVKSMRKGRGLPGSPDERGSDSALGLRNLDQPLEGRYIVPASLRQFMQKGEPRGRMERFLIEPNINKQLIEIRRQKKKEQKDLIKAQDPRYPPDQTYPQKWYEHAKQMLQRVEGEEKQQNLLSELMQEGGGPVAPRRPRPSQEIDVKGMNLLDLAQMESITPGQAFQAFQDMSQWNRTEQLRQKTEQQAAPKENQPVIQNAPYFFEPEDENRAYPATR